MSDYPLAFFLGRAIIRSLLSRSSDNPLSTPHRLGPFGCIIREIGENAVELYRLTVGPRGLKDKKVEWKRRRDGTTRELPLDRTAEAAAETIFEERR